MELGEFSKLNVFNLYIKRSMGKKKIGKQRKDKFYFLAKEAGLRSRAAFKLLQLNKRFEFLQRCRALVDLCAAPGGWLQVAEQQMPVSSLRIGVDLVPIKPIKNCITLQGDIVEEKTRHAVRKELGTWEADCVLHDGAPNVGTNWAHDAFQQNCLVLSALRLATQVLRKGGFFVTKIFRSADSQCLIAVFEKLFRKVHVWKPSASRLESAEIFVVCEHYSKPDKVQSELLDSKKVFSVHSDGADEENDKKKLQRLLLHPNRKERKAKALGYENEAPLGQHRGLGATEFLASKNALQLLSRASELVLDSERVLNSEHTTAEIKECLKDIKVCGPSELRSILKWRKKLVEEQKKDEKMSIENGVQDDAIVTAINKTEQDKIAEAMEAEGNDELKELEEIDELIRMAKAEEKSKLKKRKRKLLKAKQKLMERKKLKMVHEGDEPTLGEDLELFSLKTMRKLAERASKATKGIIEEEEEGEDTDEEDKEDDQDRKSTITSKTELLDDGLKEAIEEEEEERDVKNAENPKLTPEQLAMGEEMIYSGKRARDLENWAWNRYTNNDEALPEWFVSDEKRHCRLEPPVDKERVDFYALRERQELNVRPIKKVAEAKARKRQRRIRRMERAKKKAEGIVENEQMEHGEKVRELRRLYKKAGSKEKRQVKYQVVTKGKRGAMSRPEGPYRLVDKRMKKDTRGQRKTSTKQRQAKTNRSRIGRKGKMKEKNQEKQQTNNGQKNNKKMTRKKGGNARGHRLGGERKRKR